MAEEGGGRMWNDHPDRPRPEQDRPHAPVRRCSVSKTLS
jgi:hypothetical protein